MITHLHLEHFKSVDLLDIDVGPITVLVGPNNCGKSNIIDALRFVRDAVRFDLDRAVSDRHGINSIRQWSPYRPYNVTVSISLKTDYGKGNFSLTLGSSKGQYKIIQEEGSWEGQVQDYLIVGDFEDSDIEEDPEEISRITRYIRNKDGNIRYTEINSNRKPEEEEFRLDQRDDLFINVLPRARLRIPTIFSELTYLRRALDNIESYAIFPNTLRQPQTPSNDSRLSASGDNLTSILKLISRTRSKMALRSEIMAALKLVMPDLESIPIQSLGGLMVPTFRVRQNEGRSHDFNLSQVSDGTLRVLGLLTALYQPNQPDVIALEEPEQAVNPGVLAVLADAIKDVSDATQIITTTHSPEFVDHFKPEHILAVEMLNGVTRVGPVNEGQRQAVRERLFTLGELMTVEGLHSG